MLSKYDLGGLLQLIFVPKEKTAEQESTDHFLHLAFTSAFVNSSSSFSSNGLTCLSMSINAVVVLVAFPKLATKKRPTRGSSTASCREIVPVWFLSNT